MQDIEKLSIRLSTGETVLGSGFLIQTGVDAEFTYVLTATHCFDNHQKGDPIILSQFDYGTNGFIDFRIISDEYKILSCDSEVKYDISVMKIPSHLLPMDIPFVSLGLRPERGEKYFFRGFPQVYNFEIPEELNGICVLNIADQAIIESSIKLEDNSSSALFNVTGFSGSGLYSDQQGSLTLVGIVIEVKPQLQRFFVQTFENLNQLLISQQQSPWTIRPCNFVTKKTILPVSESAKVILFSRQFLEKAGEYIEELKPSLALALIQTAEPQITSAGLNDDDQKQLLARLNIIKAQAYSDLRENKDINDLLIKSYKLDPNVVFYRERAATAFFLKGDEQKAMKISELLLEVEENNPRAWSVMSEIFPTIEVPQQASSHPDYKIFKLSLTAKAKSDMPIKEFGRWFNEEVETGKLPGAVIPRMEIYYWIYVAQYALYSYLDENVKTHSIHLPDNLQNAAQIKYSLAIYEAVMKRIGGTEVQFNSFFLLAHFDYLYCRFLLYDDLVALSKMFVLYMGDPVKDFHPFEPVFVPLITHTVHKAFGLLFGLIQFNENEKALSLIENYPLPNQGFLPLLKGHVLEKLGRQIESNESYERYLEITDFVREEEFENFVQIVQKLQEDGLDTEQLIRLSMPNKTYFPEFSQRLLEAFILMKSAEHRELVEQISDSIYEEHLDELNAKHLNLLGIVYYSIRRLDKTIQLLDSITDSDSHPNEQKLIIACLWKENTNLEKVLRLLRHWRKNYLPDGELLKIELEANYRLRHHEMVEQICEYGMLHFPEDALYFFRLLESLNWQRKQDQLRYVVTENLHHYRMHWQTGFKTAHLCFVNGLTDEGLELSYKILKQEIANPLAWEAYFNSVSSYPQIDQIPYPAIVGNGMVVRIVSGDRTILYELTEDNINYHPFGNKLLGLGVGGEFNLRNSSINGDFDYKIIQILDKYRGQLALYVDKISQNPDSSIHVSALKFDTNNPGAMLDMLTSRFGGTGTEIKIENESSVNEFSKGGIGFIELCIAVFNNNPFATWQCVTSKGFPGFPIVPLIYQFNKPVTDECVFVLDYSSLFSVYEFSQKKDIRFGEKSFIISQLLVDFLTNELLISETKRPAYAHFGITLEGITSHLITEEESEESRLKLKLILNWIKDNCVAEFVTERLALQRSDETLHDANADHQLIIIDTVFLAGADDRILISDDRLHYSANKSYDVISLEHYLQRFFKSHFDEIFVFELVRWNYRGLTLTGKKLYELFERNKAFLTNTSEFHLGLYSFSQIYNPTPRNLLEILEFIKLLYADNLSLEYKRTVSSLVMEFIFSDVKLSNELEDLIIAYTENLFYLLDNQLDYVLGDIHATFNIIRSRIK